MSNLKQKIGDLSNQELWDLISSEFNSKVFVDFAYSMLDSDSFRKWATEQVMSEMSEDELIELGWIDDTREEDLYEKLNEIEGEFYVTGTDKLVEEDDDSYSTLGEAVSEAMAFLSEDENRIVIDKSGNILFDCTNNVTYRTLFATEGTRRLELLKEGITNHTKSLMK